jgi:very-short-patch-repair endonuclease
VGRLSEFDAAAVRAILASQHRVISRDQAHSCGMTDSAVRHRIRADGPWQVVLPGIYLAGHGGLTARQRAIAAYLYAGEPFAITGPAALGFYSLPSVPTEIVDVLVPLRCRRKDVMFARLHRTSVVPDLCRAGAVSYASPARAVADAARQLSSLTDVRAVVAGSVQRGKVTVRQLASELSAGPVRGSAQVRIALTEVAAGVRSAAEAELRVLIKRERLPEPMFNAKLLVGRELIAIADAWWPDAAVIVEVDSREWHLSPADWERTTVRHARLTGLGILVLHFSPRRIRKAGREVAAEIRATLEASGGRRLPAIIAVPA